MSNRTGNLYRRTGLNGTWIAGSGVLYDDYSEESMGYHDYGGVMVKLPHDGIKPEDLNGPVVCYREAGREKEE